MTRRLRVLASLLCCVLEGAAMSADTIKSEKSIQLLFFLGRQVSHIVVMGAQHSTKE